MATDRMKPLTREEFDDMKRRRAWGEIWERFGRRPPGRPPTGIDPAELNRERVRRHRREGKHDE